MSWKSAARWILRNTVVSGDSLTPQLRFHLITENCPLWMSTPDKCPLPDPYWAFYWPGGQAITKYISDNSCLFKDCVVLDFGCGNGSASIASIQAGASVIANDIDRTTIMNFRLNRVSDQRVMYTSRNLMLAENDDFLLSSIDNTRQVYVILGDMFYDSDFALAIFHWLKRISHRVELRILVGDPDRHPLAEEEYSKRKRIYRLYHGFIFQIQRLIHKKEGGRIPIGWFLRGTKRDKFQPGYVIREHYGFNVAKVYEIFMK